LGWLSWAHVAKTSRAKESTKEMTVVYKISMEKRIYIPHAMKPHLLEIIAQQSNEWNDKRL
jgi:hypothetical protein